MIGGLSKANEETKTLLHVGRRCHVATQVLGRPVVTATHIAAPTLVKDNAKSPVPLAVFLYPFHHIKWPRSEVERNFFSAVCGAGELMRNVLY